MGERAYVACGAKGVLTLESRAEGFVIVERRPTSGEAVGFFEQDGKLWVRIIQERAEVVGSTTPLGPVGPVVEPVTSPKSASPVTSESSSAAPASANAAVEVVGKVLEVNGLDVSVSLGTADGITERSRLALRSPNPDDESARRVIGRILRVSEHRATVRLGANEIVEVGDAVRATDEPITASRVAPDRVSGVWAIRGMLRPILNIGSVGGGVLGEVQASWRSSHFHVGASLEPVGIASAKSNTIAPWSVYAFGAFDSWLFSAGLGLGAQSVNDTGFQTDAGSGITLVQLLRIGAVDGLHLAARSRAVIFHSQTDFSGLEVEGQITVSSDAWLIFRGGGGTLGYGYGEIAIRDLISGNGRANSMFLEISIGGAGVYRDACPPTPIVTSFDVCQSATVGGPLVGVGGEWRL
jgi:hypothetical protein